ncbi:hypothetical protein F5X68DRAFT_247546 [Plectosphaerella plurivora]|uniref:Uncharacterized protein n=1 Tax=Plectosphaerella plurivora TaxID=936078 RepID=A0A9P8V3K8_9PEZI|nr:hypothetical protein F5X68DRAFT_247546 [Plectosphaerella plurivora]
MASFASPPLPNSTSWTFNNKVYQRYNHEYAADAENYYYGLPTHPRLVATTSWEIPPWGRWPNRKLLQPIGSKHKINQLWYRGSPLIRKVLEILQGHDWTAVDILMHNGIWVAAQYKKTLENFNIKDIEVEIKESRVDIEDSEDEIEESNITGAGQLFVPPPHEVEAKVPVPQTPFLGLPDDLFYKSECVKKKIQISRHLVIVALTSRDFIFTENSDTNLGGSEYRWTPQKSKIWINQLLQYRFRGIKDQIDHTVAGLDKRRREMAEATEKSDQLKAKIFEASLVDSDYNNLKQTQKHLARHVGESSRRFGHVVYAAAQSTASAGWLRNYALVSPDAVAHDDRIPNRRTNI